MSISIIDKSACTGCASCVNSCPMDCIDMNRDEEGFYYPSVNLSMCVNCGTCENLCPVTYVNEKVHLIEAYAAYNMNEDVRFQSSSGGIFSLIAEYIIKKNGVVFGVCFDNSMRVKHSFFDSIDDLKMFRGSKYVQSDMGKIYRKVKSFLDNQRLVLFSGTACQISGLKAYLRKEYENLICQDIACHGVASPLMWQRFTQYREKKVGSNITAFNFRDKSSGWKNYSVFAEFECGKQFTNLAYDDLYMRAYLSKLYLRPSCYDCKVKGIEREADITLADFWGVENILPMMDDDIGTSLVLVHTDKGRKVFEALQDKMVVCQTEIEEAIKHNPALVTSAKLPEERDNFIREIKCKRFDKVVKKYCSDPLILRIKIKIARMIKKLKKG